MNLSGSVVKATMPVYFTMLNGALMWEYYFSKRNDVFSLISLNSVCAFSQLAGFFLICSPKQQYSKYATLTLLRRGEIECNEDNYINDTL